MIRFHARFRYAAYVIVIALFFMSCRKNTETKNIADDIIESAPASLIPVTIHINEVIGGYYAGIPEHYSETSKNYPVIIFLHGAGQMGNGSTDLDYVINDGIGRVLRDKKFPPNFYIDGKYFSFLVFSPQMSREPTVAEIADFIGYVRKAYRIDKSRIYLSGLSLGARIATLVAATFPSGFAALVPIAGVAVNPGFEERCETIAAANLPVWELHNLDDPLADVNDAEHFISIINSLAPPVAPKITIFPVYGHDAWTTALNPEYRENGMNVYEWMLHYTR